MKFILQDVFLLLRVGEIDQETKSLKKAIKGSAISFILLLFFSAIAIFLTSIYSHFCGGVPNNYMYEEARLQGRNYLIYVSVILAPIIEEMGFRLCLSFSAVNFSIMCGCLYVIFEKRVIIGARPWACIEFLLCLAGGILVIFIIRRLFQNYLDLNYQLTKIWTIHSKYILLLSLTSFGLLHLYNYQFTLKTLLLVPILVLPQFICGLFFSYARLKYGIIYSIILHSIYNMTHIFL